MKTTRELTERLTKRLPKTLTGKLTRRQALVLARIAAMCRKSGSNTVFRSDRDLMDDTGIGSTHTIADIRDILRDRGLIEFTIGRRGRGTATRYSLTDFTYKAIGWNPPGPKEKETKAKIIKMDNIQEKTQQTAAVSVFKQNSEVLVKCRKSFDRGMEKMKAETGMDADKAKWYKDSFKSIIGRLEALYKSGQISQRQFEGFVTPMKEKFREAVRYLDGVSDADRQFNLQEALDIIHMATPLDARRQAEDYMATHKRGFESGILNTYHDIVYKAVSEKEKKAC